MKKAFTFLFAGLVALGIISCQKTKDDVNELTEFDASYSAKINAPALGADTAVGLPIDTTVTITSPKIQTDIASKASSAKTAVSLIDEVKFTEFKLSTAGSNLNFLKELSVFLITDGADLSVAKITDIPANATSVSAVLDNVNIKNQLIKDQMQFKIITGFNSVPDSAQSKLTMDITVHVKGKKL